MRIWTRALGPFAANCYIIACPETREAAVVDPGQPDPWIKRVVRDEQLQVRYVLNTHGHLDHIGGNTWVKEWTGMPLYIHTADAEMLTDARLNGSALFGQPVTSPPADRLLQHGDTVQLGNLTLQVIHTPGHSPGGVCFYTPGHLVAGDTLFAGSVGRTDLPGGDSAALVRAIRERLFVLPGETVVYPGHGPETTIADEKEYNPFV